MKLLWSLWNLVTTMLLWNDRWYTLQVHAATSLAKLSLGIFCSWYWIVVSFTIHTYYESCLPIGMLQHGSLPTQPQNNLYEWTWGSLMQCSSLSCLDIGIRLSWDQRIIIITGALPPVWPVQQWPYKFLRGKNGVAVILTFKLIATSNVSPYSYLWGFGCTYKAMMSFH